jgi:hypothetical protein
VTRTPETVWREPEWKRAEREAAEREIANAAELLRRAGYVVHLPDSPDLSVSSFRDGSFDVAPYTVRQGFDVQVGDRVARVVYEFRGTERREGAADYVSGLVADMVAKRIATDLRPGIRAELEWLVG